MELLQSPETEQPPSSLLSALDVIKRWENGEINDLSPDGLAVAQFLQRAQIGRLSLGATTEASLL